MTTEERAEWLQELKSRADLAPEAPKDRLLAALTDSVSMLCHQLYSLEAVADGLNETVDELREALELLLEVADSDDAPDPDEYYSSDESPLYEVKCPQCGDRFAVDEKSLVKGFVCPGCGERLIQSET